MMCACLDVHQQRCGAEDSESDGSDAEGTKEVRNKQLAAGAKVSLSARVLVCSFEKFGDGGGGGVG